MTKNDGGPAFAHSGTDGFPATLPQPGMSLRDWFAGQALVAVMDLCKTDSRNANETISEMFARKAYLMADAMLAAREKMAR